MSTTTAPATAQRILEGALRALGRHGSRKLSMSDVSESAAVSRQTLYRYFPSKEHLLEALAGYERHRFESGLAAALEHTDGRRMHALVDYAFSYLRDHPALARLVETEPEFVLSYLGKHLPWLRRATMRSLRVELDSSVPVVTRSATADQVADVLLRLLVSHFVTPGSTPSADVRVTHAIVDALIGPAGNVPTDLRPMPHS
jgi:AcrR family transcriptional regulator